MVELSLALLVAFFVTVFGEDRPTDLPIIIPRMRTTISNSDPVRTISSKSCRGLRIDCGGCTSVMLCNYQNETVGEYDCASVDPSRPYCINEGVCSSSVDEACQTKSDLCPTPSKIYPDPANCAAALYCNEQFQAIKSSAPSSSYVFNFTSQSWSLRRSNADCFEINCSAAGKQNTWTAYKPNPNLSIYCGQYGPMTLACPDDSLVFNESKKQCEFSCILQGNFPHPTDTKLYYMCLPTTNGKLQLFEQSCPGNLSYNKILKNCA